MSRLASPASLAWIALLLPLAIWWYRSSRRPAAVLYSDLDLLRDAPAGWRVRLRHLPRLLRVLFIALAAVALARPQSGLRTEQLSTYGVDIVVALDHSGSMRAMDLEPNRLEVAKRTLARFVEGRPSDRLGLVVFAREAYTACPLTLDHTALLALSDAVGIAPREADGTAIGLGLAAAINRLKASDARSRVAIVLTDGVNNAGAIAPMTAARLAREVGIRVYTIGVGTHGHAPMPVTGPSGRTRIVPVPVEIDEEMLRAMARETGGRYFRATDNEALERIFETIDRLEKTERTSEIKVAWSDRFEPWLLAAGLLLFLEVGFARPLLRSVP